MRAGTASKNVLKTTALGFVWETDDPFLFLVHHKDAFPKGEENMGPHPSLLRGRNIGNDFTVKDGFRMYHGEEVSGFPSHPHRGFETITIVLEGNVDHHDSMGATARFGPHGDTQWVTTGKGIQHSEMFPLLSRDKENPMEFFQIWMNLAAKQKFCTPYFTMLWGEKIPDVVGPGYKVKVVCDQGKYLSDKTLPPPPDSWASQPGSDAAIWLIDLEEGAHFDLPPAQKETLRSVYLFEGTEAEIDGSVKLEKLYGAKLNPEAKVPLKNTGKGLARFLLLQARPIKEPVVQRGPFVLNTQQELMECYMDYQKTQFGGWPWDTHDPVIPRDKGRFARHPDGRIEKPDEMFQKKDEL